MMTVNMGPMTEDRYERVVETVQEIADKFAEIMELGMRLRNIAIKEEATDEAIADLTALVVDAFAASEDFEVAVLQLRMRAADIVCDDCCIS